MLQTLQLLRGSNREALHLAGGILVINFELEASRISHLLEAPNLEGSDFIGGYALFLIAVSPSFLARPSTRMVGEFLTSVYE